jgi:dihydroorotase
MYVTIKPLLHMQTVIALEICFLTEAPMKRSDRRVVFSGGVLVDPSQNLFGAYDVLIQGGVVHALEPRGGFADIENAEILDLHEAFIAPGFIDVHVHFREPGQEWKETIESGSKAAVLGGFTTVCTMPNTVPRNDSQEVTKYILQQAARANYCRVLPIGAVSLGLLGKEMAPLTELIEAGCVAFSDDGEPIYDALLMRRALEWCSYYGVTICCHEEDKLLSQGGCMHESPLSMRLGLTGMPSVAEEVMIARDIELSRSSGAPVHFCHVSTARGAELIRRAKNDGIPVTAEVTPHHLTLTEELVSLYETSAKMSPPLRSAEDVEALRIALKDGTLDAIASDHAPHEFESKVCEFENAAFGILGLQTNLPVAMSLVDEGAISIQQLVAAFSSGPAAALRLAGGSLKVGMAADLVVFCQHERPWVFNDASNVSKSKNSPWYGRQFSAGVEHVMVGGQFKVRAGALVPSSVPLGQDPSKNRSRDAQ